jgi:hypothetical protein
MEKTLVRIGVWCYDEGSEEQVRSKLVSFGLLGEGEVLDKDVMVSVARVPSKAGTVGSLRALRKTRTRDELGDTVHGREEVEMSFEGVCVAGGIRVRSGRAGGVCRLGDLHFAAVVIRRVSIFDMWHTGALDRHGGRPTLKLKRCRVQFSGGGGPGLL